MTKKFLVSLAAVAALSTSAMAYEVNELSQMRSAAYNINTAAAAINVNNTRTNALLFPVYYAVGSWSTTIKLLNTNNLPIVAKVVFYSAKDSKELKDFNIYLSANDATSLKIYQDADGNTYIYSEDGSVPLEGDASNPYPMASKDKPFKAVLPEGVGYIQVIGMVEANTDAHGSDLRKAYTEMSKKVRLGGVNTSYIFSNGVVQNGVATLPYVDLSTVPAGANKGTELDNTTVLTFNKIFTASTGRGLIGFERITDAGTNKKDMVLNAVALQYDDGNAATKDALVYLEGEKANLADVEITPGTKAATNAYKLNNLITDLYNVSGNKKEYYIPYGEADANNMQVVSTSPFKRVIVQSKACPANSTNCVVTNAAGQVVFDGIQTDATGAVTNYGKYNLIAQIWNMEEGAMSAGMFSPATTPTIPMTNEVISTGTDVNDPTQLAYYINQAYSKGYDCGYIYLTNAAGSNVNIPAVITQMLATKVDGQVITNFVYPFGR
jgi:hypothetical protein